MRKEISEKISRMPMRYFNQDRWRSTSPYHKRCGYSGTEPEPERHPADYFRHNGHRHYHHHVTISPLITLIAVLVIPLSAIFMGIIKISQKCFKAQPKYLGKINGQVEEIYAATALKKHLAAKNR